MEDFQLWLSSFHIVLTTGGRPTYVALAKIKIAFRKSIQKNNVLVMKVVRKTIDHFRFLFVEKVEGCMLLFFSKYIFENRSMFFVYNGEREYVYFS